MILVVGAGLAGLTAAKVLHAAGRQVHVLEASDGVGGRVRTDIHPEGYRLDRGFQVYFPAYPAGKRHLYHDALRLRRFEPGGLIVRHGRSYLLTDPIRDPLGALPATYSPAATPLDKLRVLLLKYELGSKSPEQLLAQDERTVEEYLLARGFSHRFIEMFARPFFSGILLNRDLSTSEVLFRFYWSMLSQGDTVIPERGMGEISAQLRSSLPADAVALNSHVDELLREAGRVVGVRVGGESVRADAVVLAVEAPLARALAGVNVPEGQVSSTTVYFGGDEQLYRGRKIVLNANPDPFVNDCALLTNISPDYAPAGKHLLSASAVGVPELPDDELVTHVRRDLARLFPEEKLRSYRLLGIYRIPYAQFAQPPGFQVTLPRDRAPEPGLYLAGEYFHTSSINGAITSGEDAARLVLGSE